MRAEPPPSQNADPSVTPSSEQVLRRSATDKVIAGVAGGLARYLGLNPVLLRIAFVIIAVAGGTGGLLYVIGWFVIPAEEKKDPVGKSRTANVEATRLLVGASLLAVGGILLLHQFVPWSDHLVWPMLLLVAGAVILVQGMRR